MDEEEAIWVVGEMPDFMKELTIDEVQDMILSSGVARERAIQRLMHCG